MCRAATPHPPRRIRRGTFSSRRRLWRGVSTVSTREGRNVLKEKALKARIAAACMDDEVRRLLCSYQSFDRSLRCVFLSPVL